MNKLPILFLPGTLCTGAMFTHQMTALKQHCDDVQVVQFTTENTLKKMADKVITATNGKPCAIIGFSMGGIVALEVAKTHPQLIGKLAMINSNCHADLPERKAARSAQIAMAQDGQLATLMQETFMPNYLQRPNSNHQQLILQMALELGPHCFEAQVRAIEDRPDALKTLQSLNCDIQIIGGLEDKVCTADHQHYIRDNVSHSQLDLLSPCGHFAPLEQAEHVSTILCDWYCKPLKKE